MDRVGTVVFMIPCKADCKNLVVSQKMIVTESTARRLFKNQSDSYRLFYDTEREARESLEKFKKGEL